jgi:hypothetical protein
VVSNISLSLPVRRRESGDTAQVKRTLARPAATDRLRASADPTPAPPTGVSIAASPVVAKEPRTAVVDCL